MRTVIAALLLSIAAGSAIASPFTAIGLPYVFGHESQPRTTGWWAYFEAAIEQQTPRIILSEEVEAELFGEIAPIAPIAR